MPNTLTMLKTASSNLTATSRWPYLGNIVPTPAALTLFDDPDVKAKFKGGLEVTIYAGACEGLRRLAMPGLWSASKVGVTTCALHQRLRYIARDAYGSHYRCDDGRIAPDYGWDEWMAQHIEVSTLSPSSPVQLGGRGLRVRLPATLSPREFDKMLSGALNVIALDKVMATAAGQARVALLGLDPGRYSRFTVYDFSGSSRTSRARELVWFRPRLDGDALVAIVEALIADHLRSLGAGAETARAAA